MPLRTAESDSPSIDAALPATSGVISAVRLSSNDAAVRTSFFADGLLFGPCVPDAGSPARVLTRAAILNIIGRRLPPCGAGRSGGAAVLLR